MQRKKRRKKHTCDCESSKYYIVYIICARRAQRYTYVRTYIRWYYQLVLPAGTTSVPTLHEIVEPPTYTKYLIEYTNDQLIFIFLP